MNCNVFSFSFDFDNAIAAHKVWLRHLEFFIDGLEADFVDLDTLADPTHCSLGQWIDGSGRKYAGLPHFARLDATHREFHLAAAAILTDIRQQNMAAADALLKGRLSDLSAEIVKLIESMKHDFHAATDAPKN